MKKLFFTKSSYLLVFAAFFVACSGNQNKSTDETTEETETIDSTEANAPAQVLYVIHDVNDYNSWKPGFDDHQDARTEAGLKTIGVARAKENSNRVHVALAISDIDKAKAFSESEELKQKMEEVGVTGAPDIMYMEEVNVADKPSENNNRVVIIHEVTDFDTWKSAFDEHESARGESGLVVRGLFRGIDNSNFVYIVFGYEDEEKLDAFLSSEDLKAKMKEAGVVGEPTIEKIEWEELNLDNIN